MSVEVFHGCWKIIECVNISNSRSSISARIEGAVFMLQENGEIKWDLSSPDVDPDFLLFQCDCYEVVHTFVGVCIQMGAVSGHMFEFWVDRPVPRDMMLLTFEGWCMIQCQQIQANHPPLDFPFSFLPAFTEGYFSDMKLPLIDTTTSNENYAESDKPTSKSSLASRQDFFEEVNLGRRGAFDKEFKVHSVILELSDCNPQQISKLPTDVLNVVLHFLYSQSLPSSLTEDSARKCISYAPSSMCDFVQLCQDYVHRSTLKEKIVKLVNEVHSCAEAMTSAFREHSVISPSRFCYVIKLALRDAAVAFMKLVELCVLYGEEAPVLNRNERLEILRYAKTRLPIFLTQFVALLRNVKNDFATVKPSERNDIAAHVAPEIETLLEALSNLMREARDACNEIWAKWSTQQHCGGGVSSPPAGANNSCCGGSDASSPAENTSAHTEAINIDSLTEALYGIFRKREIVKLHHVQGQVAAIYLYLAQKKENFEEMTTAVKVRCVSRNLEQLLEELPVFLLRLEEIMIAFDDRFQWKDFKFCLQLAISQVCQTVQHLRREKTQLQRFFRCLSELVQRDEFHQSLINLGLLEVPTDPSAEGAPNAEENITEETTTAGGGISTSKQNEDRYFPDYVVSSATNPNFGFQTDFRNSDLNLVENLCTPKRSKNSILARNSVNLFETKEESDMVFEIPQEGESIEIPAHRVIVAARCDWFRRALLSGMKESIQKRIVIHDCSAQVFQLFLRFVYTGQINSEVTLEILSELIALADRYELDMLKLYCEQELAVRHLDEASVIFLLSMADQYNARTLRGATMEYIASNPGIMGKELFEELSPELQMEVYDITMWSKPKKVFSIPDELLSCPRYMLVPDSPSEDSSSSSSSSPVLGRRSRHTHTHRHHHHFHSHAHGHPHSHPRSDENPLLESFANFTTDTSSTSFTVQQAIANSIAEQNARRSQSQGASGGGGGGLSGSQKDLNTADKASETRDESGELLDQCVSQLKDVLGDEVEAEELRRIALTADFDVNRALNFFFSNSNNSSS